MKNDRLLKKAKKKVKQKKDFYTHAMVMAAVSVFLLVVNFLDSSWEGGEVLIPISAMWLSVAIHYFSVFGLGGINEKAGNWEADAIEEEYLRLKELEDRKVELMDDDKLRLKQLEKRYKSDDFV